MLLQPAGIAQSVEHRTLGREVLRSNPASAGSNIRWSI